MALAKTTRPTQAGVLARPRLFEQLDRARAKPVTWMWAPPGAGKTTLVASYLAARKPRGLWYQIDEGDADVATFFYYLGLAAPRRRQPLPLLTPEYRQGLAVFARHFFRELYERLKAPFIIVFDNYQEAPAGVSLHSIMAEAVSEIPRGGRMIFLSRSGPPPDFARHQAERAITVIDWPQLRFTPRETTGLVRRLAPGRWSDATLRSLYDTADGWCAGLVLLLDQLRREGRASPGPSAPSSEVLFDYFAGEVFKKALPETQDVLLRTAFLPEVTVSMAKALTGHPDAGEILAALHKQNYFTNKQAGAEPTYRYHPLFREFLLSQTLRMISSERRAEIRRAAAGLLEAAGRIEAAAVLLRDAEDWEGLALMIHRHAQSLLAQGRSQTVEEWLERIPPALFARQPWLLVWRGIGWLAWRHSDCQRTLEQAFLAFRQQGDAIGMFVAWSGIIFAYMSEGAALPMDRWIAVLDEIVEEAHEFPSKGVETRVAAAMFAAIVWRQPHHPQAARWARRALALARGHPDLALRTVTAANWMYYHAQGGELAEIAVVSDEMRALMHGRDMSAVSVVNAAVTVAWYESLSALPSYRHTVNAVLELAQTTGIFYSSRHLVLCGGIVGALSDGDLDTAAAWLRELERDLDLLGPAFRFWHCSFVVWEALIRRDIARATSYQSEMLRLSRASGRPLDEAVAHLLTAHALHARGERTAAHEHVGHALEVARTIRSSYVEFMGRLTQAHLLFGDGLEAEGRRALTAALALGREKSYVNTLVWIPHVMAGLCARAVDAGIEAEYVRALVQKRGLVPDSPPVEVEAWPWPVKIFTLGRFEVLRDGQPVRFPRKVQKKPLALLKALIALGGHAVREDLVMDALWPEAEGDAARVALASAVHRLRALLRHDQAIVRRDGELSLDERFCWVDAWAVERLLGRAEAAASPKELARKAGQLYRGAFLGDREVELPRATSLADGLRRRLLRQLVRIARQCEQTDGQEAADWYEEGLRVDPCAEDVYRSLMSVHHRLGHSTEVEAVYRRCRATLAAHLGTTPSPETRALLGRPN